MTCMYFTSWPRRLTLSASLVVAARGSAAPGFELRRYLLRPPCCRTLGCLDPSWRFTLLLRSWSGLPCIVRRAVQYSPVFVDCFLHARDVEFVSLTNIL